MVLDAERHDFLYFLDQCVKDTLSLKIWGDAAKHHCGAGIEEGVDVTVFRRLYRKLVSDGSHQDAALLSTP